LLKQGNVQGSEQRKRSECVSRLSSVICFALILASTRSSIDVQVKQGTLMRKNPMVKAVQLMPDWCNLVVSGRG